MTGLLSFVALFVATIPALGQWSPQGQPSVFVDLAGRVVSRATINTSCRPWGPDGNPGTADDPATGDELRRLFLCRYLGGAPFEVYRGNNPQGFANENFIFNRRALEKLGIQNPTEELQWDFAVSHPRTCHAYGLECASSAGEPAGALPGRLVEYCDKLGWDAPGHPASNPACRAFRSCERSQCPCWQESRSASSPGGAWVYFDPTRPECRPDRSLEPEPEPEDPEPEPEPEDPGPEPTINVCQLALRDLRAAADLAGRVCR